MCQTEATRTVTVGNPEGIHLRAATLIAKLVRSHNARVVLQKENNKVEGTDVLQILSLGTAEGEQLVLEATGNDAEKVLEALAKLFDGNFHEDDGENMPADGGPS
jgi:phosphotransferase system HPr (HPr) family protein